jgi:hypothetical protein
MGLLGTAQAAGVAVDRHGGGVTSSCLSSAASAATASLSCDRLSSGGSCRSGRGQSSEKPGRSAKGEVALSGGPS